MQAACASRGRPRCCRPSEARRAALDAGRLGDPCARSATGVCAAADGGLPGTGARSGARDAVDAGVLGAILFGRNVGPPEETARLVRELKHARPDRSRCRSTRRAGGWRGFRGGPFTALPPMRAIGHRGDVEVARRVGRLLAFELRATGLRLGLRPGPRRRHQADQSGHRRPELRLRAGGGRPHGRRTGRGAGARRGGLVRQALPGAWRHAPGQPPDPARARARPGAARARWSWSPSRRTPARGSPR